MSQTEEDSKYSPAVRAAPTCVMTKSTVESSQQSHESKLISNFVIVLGCTSSDIDIGHHCYHYIVRYSDIYDIYAQESSTVFMCT